MIKNMTRGYSTCTRLTELLGCSSEGHRIFRFIR
jgi:hypothetical protein